MEKRQLSVKLNELEALKKVFSCFPSIRKVILFGSRVKGGCSEKSDLDIFLEIKGKTSGQISDMKNRIQHMLSVNILYPIHIKEKNEIFNQQLLSSINREGRVLEDC